MSNKAIIVTGNLSDGFTFTGPFASFDDALEHDEKIYQKQMHPTWIATLEKPDNIDPKEAP